VADVTIEPGIYSLVNNSFVEGLSKDDFDVEVFNPSVKYVKSSQTFVVADTWTFMLPYDLPAIIIYALPETHRIPFKITMKAWDRSVFDTTVPLPDKQTNFTNGNHADNPLFSIDEISNKGIVRISCNMELNRTWNWNATIFHFALNLYVLPAQSQTTSQFKLFSVQKTKVDWSVVAFKEQILYLSLNFNDPLTISSGFALDTLEISTNGTLVNTLFVAKEGTNRFTDQ
jgi:hypothetical protein